MNQTLSTVLFIGFLIGEFVSMGLNPTAGMMIIAIMFWIRLDIIDDETNSASSERILLVRSVRGRMEYLTRSDDGSLVELPDCKGTSFTELEAQKIDPQHKYIWEKEFRR